MRRGPAVAAPPSPHATRPLDGTLNPAMMRNAVDLPHPEGPSSDTNSPGRTSRSRPSSATTAGPDEAGGAMTGAGTFRNQVGGQVGMRLYNEIQRSDGERNDRRSRRTRTARDQGSTLDIGDGVDFALTSLAVCRGG